MGALNVGVILAATWCAGALAGLYFKAKAFGGRKLYSKPAGDALAGVRYAFLQGMAPRAKESVRLNPLSYLAGMVYHAGLFAALALLAARITGLGSSRFLGIAALAGALGGVSLLGKRAIKAHLRGLSCLDDFISNLLATAFAALAGLAALATGFTTAWLCSAVALLVYAPIGKIRHCVFFFPTRYHFGAFFGRRGVLPPSA